MRQLTILVLSMMFVMSNTQTALGQQTATDWLNEGQKLADQGRYTEAIQAYDKGIALSPQWTDLYYHKGTAFSKLSKFDDAIQAFNKVNEINPKDGVVAYYWIGRTLSEAGRYDEAIQAYDKSIESFNTYGEWGPGQKSICAQSWYYKGTALDALGRSDEAQKAYDNAIKLNPTIIRPNVKTTVSDINSDWYVFLVNNEVFVDQESVLKSRITCGLTGWGTDCSKTVGEVAQLQRVKGPFKSFEDAKEAYCKDIVPGTIFSYPFAPGNKAKFYFDGKEHWITNAPAC